MNEIKVLVSFKKGKCYINNGYNPIDKDYNTSKFVFDFEDDYDGIKVLEIRPEESSNKDATFSSIIIDNEVILTNFVNNEHHSIFNQAGRHIIEVHVYGNNSKITAISEPFYVKEEQININGEQAVVFLPVFEQIMQKLNNGLNCLDESLDETNAAIEKANNLDLDISIKGKIATIDLTKKDGSKKSVSVRDGYDLDYDWNGTSLGIRREDEQEYEYVNLKGEKGECTFATFEIINGRLKMNKPDELSQLNFSLNNRGHLELEVSI